MHRILNTRFGRFTAAALASLMLAGPVAAPAAQAAVAPAIDTNWPAPTPNSDQDPFYTPPTTIPAGNPGDVIRSRPSLAGPPTARSLANAWQVMYLSTNALGKPDVVTGTVLVPKSANPATAPVVSFAPGTTGPAFRCTVSRFINSGSFYEQPAVNAMLKLGYVVVVTDYEGYHENPTTSYIVGQAMGPAVLDMVRAATRLPAAGLSATPKTLIRGYSQGGGAAMWAGQLAPTYAPELNVLGVAAGGVPGDLSQVAVGLEGSSAFGFELNALIGLDNAYPNELNLAQYLNPTGVSTLANMNANDCTVELLLSYQGKRVGAYTTTSPFLEDAWLARVDENKLGKVKLNMPVFQYHGTADTIVKFAQADQLHKTLCSLGTTETWQTYPVGHITGVARGNADVMAFLKARLDGTPATSNC